MRKINYTEGLFMLKILFHLILTLITGGLWLVVLLIAFLLKELG